jgi:hypothetical protein
MGLGQDDWDVATGKKSRRWHRGAFRDREGKKVGTCGSQAFMHLALTALAVHYARRRGRH